MNIDMIKHFGIRRYLLHLTAKVLRLHAKIENGQPIGIMKKLPLEVDASGDDGSD